MQVKVYDLENEGTEFKADFNKFKRVKKIIDERSDDGYRKIDLVTDKSNRLFLCKRFADFKNNEARMALEEIKGFKYEEK